MLPKRLEKTRIGKEMNTESQEYWFDYVDKKVLPNVDTFYFSCTFAESFRRDSNDPNVKNLREYFVEKKMQMKDYEDMYIKIAGQEYILDNMSYASMYNIHYYRDQYFDIFIAPIVPTDKTSQVLVQIRSYTLWLYGEEMAVMMAQKAVEELAGFFNLTIENLAENRVDYCWHTNYIHTPEKFFDVEKFGKQRQSYLREGYLHFKYYGNEDSEIDYLTLGSKRNKTIFIRFYHKTKEVIEQGYKSYFFKIWEMNHMINKYDMYVYEKCYVKRNWEYRDKARLEFYLEYGEDEEYKELCRELLLEDVKKKYDAIKKLADQLTPALNVIVNNEYQVMRKFTKTIAQLVQNPDVDETRYDARLKNWMYCRELICQYLVTRVFRLVEPTGDENKSRRPVTAYWKRIQTARIDKKKPVMNKQLVREYHHEINKEMRKQRLITDIISLKIATQGDNEDNLMYDAMDAIMELNDNDIERARVKKQNMIRRYSEEELVQIANQDQTKSRYVIIDDHTGEIVRRKVDQNASTGCD